LLRGSKLKGSWALVKMQHGKNDWLLIKHRDEFIQKDGDVLKEENSVLSGLSLDDLKKKASPTHQDKIELKQLAGVKDAPFPSALSPMLATIKDAPFSDSKWIFEPKLDGYRIMTYIHNGGIKLLSRRGLDVSQQYPLWLKTSGSNLPKKWYWMVKWLRWTKMAVLVFNACKTGSSMGKRGQKKIQRKNPA